MPVESVKNEIRIPWYYFIAQQKGFRWLWAAQSISVMGSQVSLIAFPLAALTVLDASASEVGILSALERAPFLVFGIFAGVLIDRWRARRVLVITDWVRAVALLLIPMAMLLDVLTIEWLFAVAFVIGACTVFFDIAYQSALTSVVVADDLLTANRWLETSKSIANVSGPGLAAVLLKVMSAPVALAVDALSFVLSALFVHSIRNPEPRPSRPEGTSIWKDFWTGLGFIATNTFLRWNAIIAASWNLLYSGFVTIFFVYLARDLALDDTVIAILVFVGSAGSFLGVAAVPLVNRWTGLGWCMVIAMCTGGLGGLILAVAGGSSPLAILAITCGFALINAAEPLFNINAISIRQMITPSRLMARTTGSIRFVVWGTLPIGALIAGFLGDALGGRTTMVIVGLGFLFPVLMSLISPFRQFRTIAEVDVVDSEKKRREGVLDAGT
ncbi:MFS transporter [Kineosporia sp. J2-2]|uniref:MFS transporter n=1 Tax=Kineosporia corallincola TaxID=2835133 RepID=A0ABS5TR95_9ACTN|nr:MFS transporter [Kineosporia corallincola]MBT0772974.1 MFS transporter [Kineosporia corallincola]